MLRIENHEKILIALAEQWLKSKLSEHAEVSLGFETKFEFKIKT